MKTVHGHHIAFKGLVEQNDSYVVMTCEFSDQAACIELGSQAEAESRASVVRPVLAQRHHLMSSEGGARPPSEPPLDFLVLRYKPAPGQTDTRPSLSLSSVA